MTIHYHGTPITPRKVLQELAGKHFCVSYYSPADVKVCHEIGQSVMLDNGAFSAWKLQAETNWPGFYDWCDEWLAYPTTWAVIPDVIVGTDHDNDRLIDEWPHGHRGAPVWHMHESIDRLKRLVDEWPRVCFGSSKQYAELLTPHWCRKMDEAWNAISRRHLPYIHMLRGMQLVRHYWPFASVDSTDVARNHNRPQNTAKVMAERWDGNQCPAKWVRRPEQLELIGVA